jgi:hypothetical protein
VHTIPGHHESFLELPNVEHLIPLLDAILG